MKKFAGRDMLNKSNTNKSNKHYLLLLHILDATLHVKDLDLYICENATFLNALSLTL